MRVYAQDRVVKFVTAEHAQRMVDDGRATCRIVNGVLMGIDLVEYAQLAAMKSASKADAKSAQPSPSEQDARRSCVVLSKAEVDAIVTKESRTAAWPVDDPRRDARVAAGLPEMDLTERARQKLKAWDPGKRKAA